MLNRILGRLREMFFDIVKEVPVYTLKITIYRGFEAERYRAKIRYDGSYSAQHRGATGETFAEVMRNAGKRVEEIGAQESYFEIKKYE